MKIYRGNLNAYFYAKEASVESLHILWFQLYGITEKAKPWRQERVQGCHQWTGREGWDEHRQHKGFLGQWTALYDAILLDPCHYTLSKATARTILGEKPSVNCALWVMMRYIGHNKWTISWGMSIMGEAGQAGRRYMGNLWTSLQFRCVPKTVL